MGGQARPDGLRRLVASIKRYLHEPASTEADVGVRQLARVEAGWASPSLLWLMDVARGLQVPTGRLVDDLKNLA